MDFQPIPGVLVLGLGHKGRHGKDSCAQAMLESAPADVLRIGFADALYDYCRVERGMTTKDPILLQHVGVEMRARRPGIWISTVYWKIMDKKPKVVVIPDVRFLNEAEFIKAMGGYTIKIDRRVSTSQERRDTDDAPYQALDRDPNHVSETELDGYSWDLTITNRDLPTALHNAVVALNFFRDKFRVEGPHA